MTENAKIWNAIDYGIVPDAPEDQAPALNELIQRAAECGAGVRLAPGNYTLLWPLAIGARAPGLGASEDE